MFSAFKSASPTIVFVPPEVIYEPVLTDIVLFEVPGVIVSELNVVPVVAQYLPSESHALQVTVPPEV